MITTILYITLNYTPPKLFKEVKLFPEVSIYSKMKEFKPLSGTPVYFEIEELMKNKDLLKDEKHDPEEKRPEKLIIPQEIFYGEAIGVEWI